MGELAHGCSGGRQEDRMECFSLRFMWRFVLFSSFDTQFVLKPKDSGGGEGELYTYLPLTQQ